MDHRRYRHTCPSCEYLGLYNELALGKARDISIETESQSPFVISLIPSVGAANDRTQRRTARNPFEDTPREPKKAGPKRTVRGQLVALQAPKKQPTQKVDAEGKQTPFALGLLEVTVSVSIDFELIEK